MRVLLSIGYVRKGVVKANYEIPVPEFHKIVCDSRFALVIGFGNLKSFSQFELWVPVMDFRGEIHN